MGAFCCDKPSIIDGMVFFAFQKTPDGNGESYGSEVFLMRSRDLLRLHSQGRAPPGEAASLASPPSQVLVHLVQVGAGERPVQLVLSELLLTDISCRGSVTRPG